MCKTAFQLLHMLPIDTDVFVLLLCILFLHLHIHSSVHHNQIPILIIIVYTVCVNVSWIWLPPWCQPSCLAWRSVQHSYRGLGCGSWGWRSSGPQRCGWGRNLERRGGQYTAALLPTHAHQVSTGYHTYFILHHSNIQVTMHTTVHTMSSHWKNALIQSQSRNNMKHFQSTKLTSSSS